MYSLIRPLLFALPPEQAHAVVLQVLKFWAWLPKADAKSSLPTLELASLRFRNRVGIAAGFDKNAVAPLGCERLGVGFVEIGTVTPRAQSGNARPRLFRLRVKQALINHMGFNSSGAEQTAVRLRGLRRRPCVPLGINIGANRDTPITRAVLDYEACMAVLFPFADYFAVNISSPNTPGLRDLQSEARAGDFFAQLVEFRDALALDIGRRIPLFAKISPDLSETETSRLVRGIREAGCDGLIATNTTASRRDLGKRAEALPGGLSGRPLLELSSSRVALARSEVGPRFPIIGVGGVHDLESAKRMHSAGADLIQLYTALVFEGPRLIRSIAAGL